MVLPETLDSWGHDCGLASGSVGLDHIWVLARTESVVAPRGGPLLFPMEDIPRACHNKYSHRLLHFGHAAAITMVTPSELEQEGFDHRIIHLRILVRRT